MNPFTSCSVKERIYPLRRQVLLSLGKMAKLKSLTIYTIYASQLYETTKLQEMKPAQDFRSKADTRNSMVLKTLGKYIPLISAIIKGFRVQNSYDSSSKEAAHIFWWNCHFHRIYFNKIPFVDPNQTKLYSHCNLYHIHKRAVEHLVQVARIILYKMLFKNQSL